MADFSDYFDSGILVKIYRLKPGSAEAASPFAAATLCRTLDLLHVSIASVLQTPRFHTGDKRQAALAEKAELRVSFLDLSEKGR